LKLFWATQQVPDQPGLHTESLSQKTIKQNKTKTKIALCNKKHIPKTHRKYPV
jgi:hypothetical protein